MNVYRHGKCKWPNGNAVVEALGMGSLVADLRISYKQEQARSDVAPGLNKGGFFS